MQPKFKLPDYSTASVTQPTFKPFQTTTQPTPSQSGGFTGLKPFGYVEQPTKSETEVDAQIKSLQSQVANLEKRLGEVGAGEEVDSRNFFEKITNLPEGQVWWMDVFDIIDRPLQALKYGVTEGSLGSAWQAFSGNREYMSGVEFLDNIGAVDSRSLNDTQKLILNIGVDVFADPLNYIAPIKILKKLGILSDTKVVSRMQDLTNTLRRDGMIQVSKKTFDDAVVAVKQQLNIADDIDIIRNFDALDDALKPRVIKALQDNGVYLKDGFETYVRRFGQTVDATTGRVRFMANTLEEATGWRRAAEEALQNANQAEAVAKNTVDTLLVQSGRKARTTADQTLKSANQLLNKTTDAQQRQVLTQAIEGLQNASDARKSAKVAFDSAEETVKRIQKGTQKAGAMTEAEAAEQLREALQKQMDEVFEDVSVVVGDARAQGFDLQVFYRNADGAYVKLNKTFEIKQAKRFSAANPQFAIVDSNSVNVAKAKYEALQEGTDAYIKAYNDYLEQVQVLRYSGGAPTMRISPSSKFRDKFGPEGVDKFNRKISEMLDVANQNGVLFSDYVKAMRGYFDEVDKIVQGRKLSQLSQAELDQIKALRDTIDLPENVTRTFTLKAGDEIGDSIVRELLDMEIALNPNTVYGAVDANGKLVLLTADEYMQYSKLQELSIQTKTNKGVKEIQTKVYQTLNLSDIPDFDAKNNLFIQELFMGAEETVQAGQVLVQETVRRQGLVVKMLNRVADANIPFISPAINFLKQAGEGLAFAFNATKGLEDELALTVSKLSAEGQVIAKNSIDRVTFIVDDIVKRTKGVYKAEDVKRYVSKILESGWDGIETAGRAVSMEGFLKRALMQYKAHGKVIFSAFDNPTTMQNFIDQIATFFRGQGLKDDFFKITDKGKYSLLEFADDVTYKELEELITGLPPTLAETQLSFGKTVLSAEELRFARRFNDDIQSMILEQKSIQDILFTELGFDAFPDDILGTGAYFRHAINPDMLRIIKGKSPASIKKFLDAGTDMLRDRIYVGSIDEINAGLRELFNIPMDVFSTDAVYNFADLVRVAMNKREMNLVLKEMLEAQDTLGKPLFEVVEDLEYTVRGMRSQYKILNNSFKAEFPNLFKNLSPDAQQTLLQYFGKKGFAEGAAKVIATQKSAYAVLKRLDNAYVNLPEFIKNYDQFMGFWKSFALITPGYHMRNLFGNVTNSYLAGMSMPAQARYLGMASQDLPNYRKVARLLAAGENLDSLPKALREAYERVDTFKRLGISQGHKGVKDLEVIKEGLEAARGTTRSAPKKVLDSIVNMNYHIAESMDDMQRYALYQWALNNSTTSQAYRSAKKVGASANELRAIQQTEAAKKVSEALFDYSHLTPFEKEYMKRLFPFFTFFKNNLIFQAKNIFQRPQQYGKLYRSYTYYTESMTGYEIEDIPDYMSGNLWLPIPYRVNRNDDEAITWLKLNLPPTDFTEFIENPFSRGVTSVTVPIKLAIELGTGRDTFTGQTLVDFPGQRSIYQDPGFLQQLRDESGRITISQDPVIIKMMNDLGLRTMINYATIGVDTVDYLQGTRQLDFTANKILDSFGISRQQEIRKMDIAALYQQLDRLRDQQKLYEQEVGDLPTLAELEAMFGQPEQREQRPLFGVFGT